MCPAGSHLNLMDDMRWASHVSLSTKIAVELDQSTNTAINKHLSENPTKNQGFIDAPVARLCRKGSSRFERHPTLMITRRYSDPCRHLPHETMTSVMRSPLCYLQGESSVWFRPSPNQLP